ncbi:MAG: hypothetical protein ISR64_07095 [Deltaproteobacteria bacterium]|nr:hypothetical protein [Deltaproteobacteria bacterium]
MRTGYVMVVPVLLAVACGTESSTGAVSGLDVKPVGDAQAVDLSLADNGWWILDVGPGADSGQDQPQPADPGEPGDTVSLDVPVPDPMVTDPFGDLAVLDNPVAHCLTPDKCDDGNPCTDDECNPDGCKYTFNVAQCNDGNPCTETDHCVGGKCVGSGFKVCDDDDACTKDACEPGVGCVFVAVKCGDGNPCTLDECDSALGCVHKIASGSCDDGDLCTFQDHCTGGQCAGVPKDCDDGDPCTTDLCEKGVGCLNEPVDYCGNPCGTGWDCDDGDPCTLDLCNTVLGQCEHVPLPSCKPTCISDQSCWDNDPCTSDLCLPIGCANFDVVDCDQYCQLSQWCDDGDPCTFDYCDLTNGHCVSIRNPECGKDCEKLSDCDDGDDGDACTVDFCLFELYGQPFMKCTTLPIPGCNG